MIERINETDVWQTLAKSKKPTIVYGMGNAAEKIIALLHKNGVEVAEIIASDNFVRGHSFLGHKVKKYSDVCSEYSDFNIALAFAVHDDKMLTLLRKINTEHSVFAPDIAVAGGGLFTREYVKQNDELFEQVYQRLADEKSKQAYLDVINFKISGKINYLYSAHSSKSEVYSDILKLRKNEKIIDLGAYDGDTIREMLSYTGGEYSQILAVEPDAKSYKKLQKAVANLARVETMNIAVSNKKETLFFELSASRASHKSSSGTAVDCNSIDNICSFKPTLIKMDIEGSELKALCGAENTVRQHAPKLYVCAYHRNEDLFALPQKIWQLNSDYKIYFRASPYIPAWETNFYCTI